jgi:hypothetical protein
MKSIRWPELTGILEEREGHLVSIYLSPLLGAESRQNSVQLEGLVRTAERRLQELGVPRSGIESLLAPAMALIEPAAEWGELGRGMAVLLSQSGARIWQLPIACHERCEVGKTFYILPLIEWLASEMDYYVLAVSQNQVRLLQGTGSEMEEVAVPGLPADRETALLVEDSERTLHAHVGRPQVPGRGDLLYHGHGGAPDVAKDEIEQYLRAIERAVAQFLVGRTEPLVFAGVDYLFPIYRRANTYSYLLPTPITGNPELWSPKELSDRSWPLVEPLVQARRDEVRTKYGDMISQGRTATGLEDVLPAAQAGAIDTLFIDPSVTRRGTFDSDAFAVRIDDSEGADSEDLINLAAVLVLRSSGAVELSSSDDIPGGDEASAVLRYPFTVPSESGQHR